MDTTKPEVGTALVAPTDDAIRSLRQKGAAMVAFTKERNELARTIEGVQWGSVNGASLSIQTRLKRSKGAATMSVPTA